jgi:hypothetical protein
MKKYFVLVSLVGVIVGESIYAQEITRPVAESSTPRSWFMLGAGITNKQIGYGGGLFFRLANEFSLGLRGGFRLESRLIEQPEENAWWISPMFQYTPFYGSVGMLSVSVGPGLTGGVRRGEFLRHLILIAEYEKISYRVPSLSGEIELSLFFTRSLGLIATGFVNLNKEQNQQGFLVGIQLRQP